MSFISNKGNTNSRKFAFWGAGVLTAGLFLFQAVLFQATPANAANFRLGEADLQIDNIFSVGASIRVEDRNTRLLPAGNGGPQDITRGVNVRSGAAAVDCGTASNPFGGRVDAAALEASIGEACVFSNSGGPFAVQEVFNYDSSINTDDGRLNFDKGDILSGTFKLTTEFQVKYENVKFFSRVNTFYDAVASDSSNNERTGFTKTADRAIGSDVDLLDFYVDFDLQPVFLRIGRQVINWGESTFILGGNSVFNPISVPAFRRPGAEIKEALIPVEAIYASVALPHDLTLEGYYGLWDNYDIDVAGTPFGNSDSFELGSAGNGPRSYVGSTLLSGDSKLNCDTTRNSNALSTISQTIANGLNGAFNQDAVAGVDAVLNADGSVQTAAIAAIPFYSACSEQTFDTAGLVTGTQFIANNPNDILTPNIVGHIESSRQRIALPYTAADGSRAYFTDTSFLARGQDSEPKDFNNDNYGIALRWYAAQLNSTEFAIYYQNYTSRIPYASSIARQPISGINTAYSNDSPFTRTFSIAGCAGALGASATRAGALGAAAQAPDATAADVALAGAATHIGFTRDTANVNPNLAVNVPGSTGYDATLPDYDPATGAPSTAGLSVNDISGVGDARRALFADPTTRAAIIAAASTTYGDILPAALASFTSTSGIEAIVTNALANYDNSSLAQGQTLGCVLSGANAVDADITHPALAGIFGTATVAGATFRGAVAGSPALAASALGGLVPFTKTSPTGTANVVTRYQTEIVAEFPEDIKAIGFSFNSTIADWGIQGEIVYRPNMPLQLDTDAISITALGASCAWENFGSVADSNLASAQTIKSRCGDWDQIFSGFAREQVYNTNLGTTATFTRSNPLVSLLQADLAVLLTEFGYVYVPDAKHYAQPNPHVSNIPRLANTCTSGSDLPLGGVFGIDVRPTSTCRPTVHSGGIVLFGQLRYNNVGGSAIGLRPTIAYNRGIFGRTPSPAAGWRKDNSSLNLSLRAEYQADWTAAIGYTMYSGDALYNRNVDRDQVALSFSYAF